MNVLHISAVRNLGGGEIHIENLYHELNNNHQGITQYILCVKNSDFHKRLKNSNFNYIPVPLKIKMDIRYIFKIFLICRSKKIDIINLHDPTALTLTVIADRIFRVLPPLVFSKKTSFPIKNRKQTLYKYNYKKIKKIICVSEAVNKVASSSIIDKDKLITIYDGIRFDNKNIEANFNIRTRYHIPNDKKIIGNIGNHIRAKNLFTFIEVVNEIINNKKIYTFHFVQIGSYTERTPMYINKIKEYKLDNHITFIGYQNNASAFLPQFDTFLLTSQSEGLPMVINESFYYKVPVVSTNPGGIPEIIKHEFNGYLTDIENSKKLADYVIDINDNEPLKKQFAENSYKQLISGFSTKQMGEKTLKVYKNIINK